MHPKMQEAMQTAWQDWHGDVPAEDIPAVNLSFERGFEAAVALLMPLLETAAPHFLASAEASHLLEGLKRKRNSMDDQAEKIQAVLS